MKLKVLILINCESSKYIAKLFSLSIVSKCDKLQTGRKQNIQESILDQEIEKNINQQSLLFSKHKSVHYFSIIDVLQITAKSIRRIIALFGGISESEE